MVITSSLGEFTDIYIYIYIYIYEMGKESL